MGKSTVSAALARAAARTGRSTLLVEVEGKSGLATMFGREPFGYTPEVLDPGGGPEGAGDIQARTITPDRALVEYLEDHGLSRVSRRLVASGALEIVATATPGIKDVLVLGKVKQLERSGPQDLIVLDAPAAGHAITFLRSARGLMDAVRVGPIRTQAAEVLEMLTDPARCTVVLVTLPEETPVNELVETAYALEEQVGVSLGPVVVNGVYPPLAGLTTDPVEAAAEAGATLLAGEADLLRAAAAFRLRRRELQEAQLERLAAELPLPQITLPFLFGAEVGRPEVEHLAGVILDGLAGVPDLRTRPPSATEAGP